MNPVDILVLPHLADGRGESTCLIEAGAKDAPRGRRLTYTDLQDAARRYAGTLVAGGVRRGCRAVVVSDDSAEAVAATLGLWWYGCVPVLVSPMLRDAEIAFVAGDCAAEYAHLAVPGERAAELRRVLGDIAFHGHSGGGDGHGDGDGGDSSPGGPDAGPGDDAGPGGDPGAPAAFADHDEVLVQYTSGSTGRPTGVRHGMAGLLAVLSGFGGVLALNRDDTVLSTAKLSFGYGFGNSVLFPLAAGAASVLLAGPVDPYTVAAAIERHRPTVLCSVPRVYAGLLDLAAAKPVATTSVRLAVAAGEHLPADLSRRAADVFAFPLVNGLGATEVLHIVLATSADTPVPGSTGIPVPGATASIRDDAGLPVPDGERGRLHVVTASAALGYLDRPDAEARTFADGGVYTGDIAYRTPDGDVRHLCRADDLLNLGGFKVAPAEIEAVLRAVDGVADCAVVADRDPAGLERAAAYVVPVDGADPEVLRKTVARALRAELAAYKRPARVAFVNALPTTSTGKLARFELRASARDSPATGVPTDRTGGRGGTGGTATMDPTGLEGPTVARGPR